MTPLLANIASESGASLPDMFGFAIDCACAVLILIGMVRGGFRGLIGEISRICGLAIAIGVGLCFSGTFGNWVARVMPSMNLLRGVLTIALTIVVCAVCGVLLKVAVDRSLRLIIDQPANSLFGIFVGAARSAALLLSLFFLLSFVAYGQFGEALFGKSRAGVAMRPAVAWVRAHLGATEENMPDWLARMPGEYAGDMADAAEAAAEDPRYGAATRVGKAQGAVDAMAGAASSAAAATDEAMALDEPETGEFEDFDDPGDTMDEDAY